MTIWRMRIAWWITKATATHSKCIIFVAFPLKQWMHERASLLHYMYIASPLNIELAICTYEYINQYIPVPYVSWRAIAILSESQKCLITTLVLSVFKYLCYCLRIAIRCLNMSERGDVLLYIFFVCSKVWFRKKEYTFDTACNSKILRSFM